MKKALLVLSILLSLTLLIACGPDNVAPPDGGSVTSPAPDPAAPAPDGETPPAPAPVDPPPDGGVSITVFMAKPEIAAPFETMLAEYNRLTGHNVTMIPLPAGQEVYERMTTLYAAGNAPTIAMIGQEFSEFQDHFLDLSGTEIVSRSADGTLDFVTVGGGIYGVPTTVEAYGVIYNPEIVASVFGAGWDPAEEINTLDGFRDFFAQLSAAGEGAFSLSPMDWSLGAHLSNTVYAAQSNSHQARHAFIEDLKSGSATLGNNAVFNGWVDFVDLLLANNIHAGSPLAPVYEDGALDLATGNAAAWFMGNWAFPMLVETTDLEYRFIPIPVSNNPGDYANNKIAIGVPSYWVVDGSQNTAEQQAVAVDFLNWFITTAEGQNFYVNELAMIPAFSGFSVQPADSMSRQIAELLNSGRSLEWMNTYYPAGGFQAMGVSIQRYIGGVIDRQGLATEFEDFWKSVGS